MARVKQKKYNPLMDAEHVIERTINGKKLSDVNRRNARLASMFCQTMERECRADESVQSFSIKCYNKADELVHSVVVEAPAPTKTPIKDAIDAKNGDTKPVATSNAPA